MLGRIVGVRLALIMAGLAAALMVIAAACTTTKEVVVERTVLVPGEQVVVERTVLVPGETVKVDVVRTVVVEGKTVTIFATPVPAGPKFGLEGQKYGGSVKIGVIDFGTMDPALMGLSEGSSLYSETTYDNATVKWYDGSVTPWAVESWTFSDDLTKYTLQVRQGIKFHHGKELKAEDVKFTFDRILDEATASPARGQLEYINNITAVDDYTVVMDLSGANVFLPAHLADYHARILPSDVDISQITSREFGSGPYFLGDHNPAERTVMERSSDYWRADRPFLDQVVLFYMPEQTTRTEALKSGALDVILEPNFSALESLGTNPNVIIKEKPTSGVRVLDFHTDREPFNNKNLRKAFQWAVDRDFVRNAALFGRGVNANDHPVGINDEYYWDEQPLVTQDIPKAKAFLAAAGYPGGFDFTLHTTDGGQKLEMALAFKESVAEAGINITVSNDDSTTYWEEFWMNPCCPFVASSWGPRTAAEGLDIMLRSTGDWNESYYNNPRLDELLDLAAAEGDFAQRKEYYREVQEILIDDVPVLFLMYIPKIVAHRTRMQGIEVNTSLAAYFMEEWWIDEK